MIADLKSLKVRLQIPASKLTQNYALRAIHLNFDHVSVNAKSFVHEGSGMRENLNAGIEDLIKCLQNEWQMQLSIQKHVHNDMLTKRRDYDEQMRLYEEQQEKNKHRGNDEEDEKKNEKKKKILKPTKEPPLLNDDMYPDVWEDFLEEEQNQYMDYIKKVYDPANMDLDCHEVVFFSSYH